MPNFARGRTQVPVVSSPLLGVSGPRGAEKEEMSNANGGFVSVLTHLLLLSPKADTHFTVPQIPQRVKG